MKALAVAAALLSLSCMSAGAAPPAPAAVTAALGGSLADPVGVDDYVYVPHGATLSAWSRAQPGAPVFLGDTRAKPADGWLTGLARRGDYLYASYRGYSSTVAGVVVYSIADRARPTLVARIDDYTTGSIRMASSVVVAGDALFLLDSENGIFLGNLANPALPVFTPAFDGFGAYARVHAEGNRLYASGRNFLGSTIVDVFDITNPAALQRIGSASLDGYDNFRVKVRPPYTFGFGLAVNVTDFTDPANPTPRGRIDAPVSYDGVLVGNYAWGVGGFDGVEVFNIANLDAPTHVGTQPIDTFSTDVSATVGAEAWLATRDDRVLRIDGANPAQPTLGGTALIPGGTAPMDIALKGDTALILGNAYGLQYADAHTLAPLGRYVTSLEQSLQRRAFEQLAVVGNRAYLTSWGSGLAIADVTNPRAPTELAFWEYPWATSIDAQGNYAYVGRSTNGGELVVLDVSNPATPTPVGTWAHPAGNKFMRLVVRGNYVFVADQPQGGATGGGLLVFDVTNPAAPTDLALFEPCGAAQDVALDPAGKLAVVACYDATFLVDITNPSQPAALGSYPGYAHAVALRGDRIYIGTEAGISEVDITNRASPTLVHEFPLPDPARRIAAPADGRVYAITGLSGLFVLTPDQLFSNGLE